MNIVQMRRGMGEGMNYPFDHKVEYIESTGTQCVDTGILGNQLYGVEYEFAPTGLNVSYQVYISSTRDNFTIGAVNNQIRNFFYRCRGVAVVSSAGLGLLPALFKSLNGNESLGQWYRTGGATPLGTDSTNVHLLSYSNRANRSKARIYFCKLYGENNELVFDGIPVRLLGKGYLYDRITKSLFGNALEGQSYGDFLYGPDIN